MSRETINIRDASELDGIVRVTVVGRSAIGLPVKLRNALTGLAAVVLFAGKDKTLRNQLEHMAPSLVIIDLTDPWGEEDATLANTLAACPEHATVVLFGAELDASALLAMALSSASRPFTALESTEGLQPLVDLVRSRLPSDAGT